MTALQVILATIGGLAVLALICAVSLWWNRNGEKPGYDERQLAEQRKAREVSDTVSIIYFLFLVCWLALAETYGRETLKPYLLIAIGLVIQVMTYHIYCVMTHAALPFGQNPKTTIFWYTLAGAVQFGNYFTHVHTGDHDDVGLINLAAGIVFLTIALLHLMTLLRKEKE